MAPAASAQTFVTNGNTQVAVAWSGVGNPVLGTDFSALTAGSTFQIVLHTGNAGWDVTSSDLLTGQPAAIDSVLLLPVSPFENFDVSIGNGVSPGASKIGEINLSAASWFGASNLAGGSLSGSLLNGLTVTSSVFGSGGAITSNFTVSGKTGGIVSIKSVDADLNLLGPVSADVTIQTINESTQFGRLSGDGNIGSVVDAWLTINGVASLLDIKVLSDGHLRVTESLEATAKMELGNLIADTTVKFVDFGGTAVFDGYLGISGGVGVNQIVQSWMPLGSTAEIDLHHGDIAGMFELIGGGSGKVIDGGVVKTNGHVWLSETLAFTFTGEATFDAVEPFGIIEAEYSTIDGLVHILGDCDGTLVVRNGSLMGNGRFQIDGNLGPQGWVGPIGGSAWAGDLHGQIEIAGDASGWISVDNSMRTGSSIIVHGISKAELRVGNTTEPGSVIALEGLGAGGQVVINNNETASDMDGLIYVGDLTFPATPQPVIFDGCIHIKDDMAGGSGNLLGVIWVAGCHATLDPLYICTDGSVLGSIVLDQPTCANQVNWACMGACP